MDITKFKSIQKYIKLKKPNIVIHLAGLSRPMSIHDKQIKKSIDLNIIGTSNITKACEENNIKGFGIGRITSVTHSPELGHWIGIGFIQGGVERWKNKTVIGSDPVRNKQMEIQIVSPHMDDPEGQRMHA